MAGAAECDHFCSSHIKPGIVIYGYRVVVVATCTFTRQLAVRGRAPGSELAAGNEVGIGVGKVFVACAILVFTGPGIGKTHPISSRFGPIHKVVGLGDGVVVMALATGLFGAVGWTCKIGDGATIGGTYINPVVEIQFIPDKISSAVTQLNVCSGQGNMGKSDY